MQLTDTHAHLYLSHFQDDIDEVIKRSLDKGVKKIILPNIDSESVTLLNNLSDKYPEVCFPLLGLHPTSVEENFKDELKIIFKSLSKYYYGIGEIGIDLYWDKSFFKEQVKAFKYQIDLAIDNNLPVVIHARESFIEIFDILKDYSGKDLKGVFHAFTGSVEQAMFIINNYGFYLGIGGIVTFKNSGLVDVIKNIGLERIVLETDSPYLAPVPYRGKRNESSYLSFVAEKIAEILGISVEQVAEITTINAANLFRINNNE